MLDYVNPTKEQIIEYLESKNLKIRDTNGQINTNQCPFCPEKKEDWTHFYISYNGLYFCQKCGERGNIIKLAKHFGDYKKSMVTNNPQKRDLTEPIKSAEELKPKVKKKLVDPEAKDLKIYKERADEYHNTLINAYKEKPTSLVRKIIEYLTKDRGFTIDTLKHFKIGWTGTSITIPIIENNKIVNIRYRKNPFDSNKKIPKMTNTVGGKMTLFNIDSLQSNNDKLVITEGEFDAMSLYQKGWGKVISVTCGAQTFKTEWVDLLEKEKVIYLCYDNDQKGNEGISIATSKLGAGKCYKIYLPKNENEIKKDLNEFFVNDKKTIDDFVKCYNKAEKIKIDYEHIKHIKEFKETTIESFEYAGKIRGLETGYPELDKLWAGMRKGNLIVISGDTSVGKTFFIQGIILNLAKQGINTMLFSLEETVEETVERFLLLDQNFNFERTQKKIQATGQTEEKAKQETIQELNLVYKKLEKKPIYLYSGYENIRPQLLGEIVEKAVRDFGCEIVFIDHLHYFATGDRRQRTTEIGDIIRYIKLLARKFQIPIVLIAHIRKLERDNVLPVMEDLKDSSAIKQDADIVSMLYRERNKTSRELSEVCVLNTDKNRHGKIGSIKFIFSQDKDNLCKFEILPKDKDVLKNNSFAEKKPEEVIQIPFDSQ